MTRRFGARTEGRRRSRGYRGTRGPPPHESEASERANICRRPTRGASCFRAETGSQPPPSTAKKYESTGPRARFSLLSTNRSSSPRRDWNGVGRRPFCRSAHFAGGLIYPTQASVLGITAGQLVECRGLRRLTEHGNSHLAMNRAAGDSKRASSTLSRGV